MNNLDTYSWKEFSYDDIFELVKVTHKLDKMSLSENGKTPVYSSDTTNNGIIGYTDREPDFKVNEDEVYIVFGDHTRSFNIAEESFSVFDNVKVLKPKYTNNIDILLFICTVWKKNIQDYGYARHWKIAKDAKIKLPVKETEEIDFEYMRSYISELQNEHISELDTYLKVTCLDDYELTEEEIKFLNSTRMVV